MPCLNRHFRIMQIKFTHAFTKNPPHSITHEPFIISRNHIPRCIFRRSMSQHIRISLHIIIPIATLFQIGSRKFPVLCLIFQPCQKASLLFIFRNIQEEFDNNRTILRQIAFIIIYLTIALFQNFGVTSSRLVTPGNLLDKIISGCTLAINTSSYCERLNMPIRPLSGRHLLIRQR